MSDVATSLAAGLDACDLIDATDIVDASMVDIRTNENQNGNGNQNGNNADFEDFTQSTTLIGETVEEAHAAAAEAIATSTTATTTAAVAVAALNILRCSISTDRQEFSSAETDDLNVVGEKQTSTSSTTATTAEESLQSSAAAAATSGEAGTGTGAQTAANTVSTASEQLFVTPKDFELLKVIGMGAFGKVLQVRNKQSSQILAMKIISKRQLRKKSGYIENVQAERNILKRVNHPFVVKMHCSFQTREKLFILMDFLAGGEMFLRLGREGIFLEKDAAFYLAEMVSGIDHLHALGILHRDLKPENILLCNDGHICLTDFGLAKDFGADWSDRDGSEDQERARTICGTQEYMAPEMVANKGYGKAADYWSLGCIFYEMLNGLPPFSSKQGSKELFRKIMSEKVKMPPGSTAAACKLLKGLLNRNPDKRLGAARSTMFEVGGVAGLKQQPFFAKIDWIKLDRKQLKPPYDLNVDNEQDYRNFHNEFTEMPLPRSVKEMTMEDHRPTRVASNTFRGFSFIQEDFLLPPRDAKEMENYWKAVVEEDGESNSDLASSKCGAEDELVLPPQSETKKRPPRKRKKKKNNNDLATMETASMASADTTTTPMPSDTEGETASAIIVAESTVKGTLRQQQQTNNDTPKKSATTTLPSQSNDTTVTSASTSTSSKTPAIKTEIPTPKTPPLPKPVVADPWQSINASGKKNRNRVAGYSPTTSKTTATAARPGFTQSGRTTLAPAPLTRTAPAPGSWAARLHNKSSTPAAYAPRSAAAPAAISTSSSSSSMTSNNRNNNRFGNAPPPPLPSPSSDWRTHASPQVRRAIKQSSLQSTTPDDQTTMNGAGGGGNNAWPSLDDFPAAPSLSSKKQSNNWGGQATASAAIITSAAASTKKKSLPGAWATRSNKS